MAVDLKIDGAIATITLNSPENKNALSRRLVTELMSALDDAAQNEDVRAVLIDSFDRVFCSGADLKEAASGSMEEGAAALVALQRQIIALPKPVVVKLAGPVRAGGLGIVGAADLVIAARSVSFSFTEVRLGLAPAVISLSLRARMSPRSLADTFLTARVFKADEAREMGLVTSVVEDDQLDSAVAAVLSDLAEGSAQGLAESKALLNADLIEVIDRDGAEIARRSAELFNSEEAKSAMIAFLMKKKG